MRLSLAYFVLLNFYDFTTVNLNKITSIIGKQFKILTNTITLIRIGDSKHIVTYRLVITSPSATNC